MKNLKLKFNSSFVQVEGIYPDKLQVLNVTSITNEECKKQVSFVHDGHLCTSSSPGKGICMMSVAKKKS